MQLAPTQTVLQTQEIPGWVLTAVGLSSVMHVVTSMLLLVIALIMVFILLKMYKMLSELKATTERELKEKIIPTVNDTLKNVKSMSDDAAATTHNVTGAVNRVTNLVGSAATRLESPVIRAVGMATGLLAGVRAVKKKPKEQPKKKRRGLFG